MRVCVLGNSHVGCLKQGWDLMREAYPNVDLTFFAARSDGLSGLYLSAGALKARGALLVDSIRHTSGGLDCIKGEDYDVFFLHGLNFSFPRCDYLLSSAVRSDLLKDVWRSSLNYKVGLLVKSMTSFPVYIGHNPQVSSRREILENSGKYTYADLYVHMGNIIRDDGFELISQPESTIVNNWNTSLSFSIGSSRLDVGDENSNDEHPPSDLRHMNAAFGRLYLEGLFKHVLR